MPCASRTPAENPFKGNEAVARDAFERGQKLRIIEGTKCHIGGMSRNGGKWEIEKHSVVGRDDAG